MKPITTAGRTLLYLIIYCFILLAGCSPRFQHGETKTTSGFEVRIDSSLRAHARELPKFEDSAIRPLATVTDRSGKQTDFVANELIVEPSSPAQLDSLLNKWNAKILARDNPRRAGIEANATYLLRINVNSAETDNLEPDLRALNPKGGAPVIVNSVAARKLIAVAASIARTGIPTGINFLTTSGSMQDGQLWEGTGTQTMKSSSGFVVEKWDPNPFHWNYMMKGGAFDIGVTEAWKLLDRTGRFKNKVKIAILDDGFGSGEDFPPGYEYNKASFAALDPHGPNGNTCTNNTPCPWHGWSVGNAAAGQADNHIGAAGPGGPVATLLAIRKSSDLFNQMQAVTTALLSGANIINMSFSARIPATLSWSVIPFSLATGRAHADGKILIASAGNEGENIDEEDCFGICWESAWWTPAENDGVMCVGAMDAAGPFRRPDSNTGEDELDIWGPGAVWVAGDYETNEPHVFGATSAAAPNIAGIAALVWAANPGMSNNDVENTIYATAHHGSGDQVSRWPDCYAAVVRAFGGTPPEINISVAVAPEFGKCVPSYEFRANVTDPDDPPFTVTWKSDLSGNLGTGLVFKQPLPDGIHHITATAMDAKGLSAVSNEVTLNVSNDVKHSRPSLNILYPGNHQEFPVSKLITLEATGYDPYNVPNGLKGAGLRWRSSRDGELGAGNPLNCRLSQGAHYIYATYTGVCGGEIDDVRLINVTAALADNPPDMHITTPANLKNILLHADDTGQACLKVGGFGFDEEDFDFATIEWWETDRTDLQWKVLSFDQNATICLKISPDGTPTDHRVTLRGKDSKGHSGYSAPMLVTVLPGIR